MNPSFHSLRLEDIRLQVRLGCLPDERERPQEVRLAVEFRFDREPSCLKSDRLEETICYARLCEALRAHCESREFKLIERIGYEAYGIARELAGPGVKVAVRAHKVRPPVEALLGGAISTCGDFAP